MMNETQEQETGNEAPHREVAGGAAAREVIANLIDTANKAIESVLADELRGRGYPEGTRYDLDRHVWLIPAGE
jgi:hypothetical protein